jgi:hypothetical protein
MFNIFVYFLNSSKLKFKPIQSYILNNNHLASNIKFCFHYESLELTEKPYDSDYNSTVDNQSDNIHADFHSELG